MRTLWLLHRPLHRPLLYRLLLSMLIGALVLTVVQAQDEVAPGNETVVVPEAAVSFEESLLTVTEAVPVDAPVSTATDAIHMPEPLQATQLPWLPVNPTVVPLEVIVTEVSPVATLPVETLISLPPLPTELIEVIETVPPPVSAETLTIDPLLVPTVAITPQSTPTTPIVASIVLAANAARLPVNAVLEVTLTVEPPLNTVSVAILCQTDAARLRGVHSTSGDAAIDALPASDGGFQANGQWSIIALMDSNRPQPLARLYYEAIAIGLTSVVCQVQFMDGHGQVASLATTAAITLETYQSEPVDEPVDAVTTATLDVDPTAAATSEVDLPESSIVLEETAIVESPVVFSTEMVEPMAPPQVLVPEVVEVRASSTVSGRIRSAALLSGATVTLHNETMQQVVNVGADGRFLATVIAGTYTVTVSAPWHLSEELIVNATDATVDLPLLTLTAGDVNEDGSINQGDVDQLSWHFGEVDLPDGAAVDLNGDGQVNLYDLVIVGANMGGAK